MWRIKLISTKNSIRLGESHAQVLQLEEVDCGDHFHHHEVHSSDEVDHVGNQIDQHEKHN